MTEEDYNVGPDIIVARMHGMMSEVVRIIGEARGKIRVGCFRCIKIRLVYLGEAGGWGVR
jgi:hypothetical protein